MRYAIDFPNCTVKGTLPEIMTAADGFREVYGTEDGFALWEVAEDGSLEPAYGRTPGGDFGSNRLYV